MKNRRKPLEGKLKRLKQTQLHTNISHINCLSETTKKKQPTKHEVNLYFESKKCITYVYIWSYHYDFMCSPSILVSSRKKGLCWSSQFFSSTEVAEVIGTKNCFKWDCAIRRPICLDLFSFSPIYYKKKYDYFVQHLLNSLLDRFWRFWASNDR